MEGGSEFQIDHPENARLLLYRFMQGYREIMLLFFQPYLLLDLEKSELTYSGVSPVDTLNTITTLIHVNLIVSLMR